MLVLLGYVFSSLKITNISNNPEKMSTFKQAEHLYHKKDAIPDLPSMISGPSE